jgi:hypothetical protein
MGANGGVSVEEVRLEETGCLGVTVEKGDVSKAVVGD